MGKFKQISITINECIKYILIGLVLITAILLLKASVENVKLKERYKEAELYKMQLIEENNELIKKIESLGGIYEYE